MRLEAKIKMTLDIWKECKGEKCIRAINETAWRMVELQEKTSTRKLVDSIEEQKVLEELIEEAKPILSTSQTRFHPLLYTPFRYPPLKHGSRFGKKTESSLWYGSLIIETAMAEKAFYQLAFINASAGEFGIVTSPMTIFSVKLKIIKGAQLNKEPFSKYENKISSPTTYKDTQLLGLRMRENDIDGFTFVSARDANMGINVGLFNMSAFEKKTPEEKSFQTWQCNTTKNNVEFIKIGSINDHTLTFSIKNFHIDGKLPFPAV